MAGSKGLYVAAAPVIFLLMCGAGMGVIPAVWNQAGAKNSTVPGSSSEAYPLPPSVSVDAKTQGQLEAQTSGQIKAIRAGNFASALLFAVPAYRKTQTPESFKQLYGRRSSIQVM